MPNDYVFSQQEIEAPVAPDSLRPLAESNPDSVCAPDESNPEETELLIRRSQKEDSNAVIHRVRMRSIAKSRFTIPLCCLKCLPLVRPISEVDVSRLENEFVMGYHDGDHAMYVSPYNNLDEVLQVSDDIRASWSSYW